MVKLTDAYQAHDDQACFGSGDREEAPDFGDDKKKRPPLYNTEHVLLRVQVDAKSYPTKARENISSKSANTALKSFFMFSTHTDHRESNSSGPAILTDPAQRQTYDACTATRPADRVLKVASATKNRLDLTERTMLEQVSFCWTSTTSSPKSLNFPWIVFATQMNQPSFSPRHVSRALQ